MRVLAHIFLALLPIEFAIADSVLKFTPHSAIEVVVAASKASIDYSIASSRFQRERSIALEIESEPRVELGDFNFDGLLDFSVWYFDEGMGKSTIHRIFIYDPKLADFLEVAPSCGDEFLNLRVDKARHRLLSVYYVSAHPIKCSTRLRKSRR